MRDVLTALAGLLIVVLAAALVVPPFIDWDGQRDAVDRAISRAIGVEARTEGTIRVHLLPSPRLRVDRLRLGSGSPEEPSLDAQVLKTEMALVPLLSGQVRFTQTRAGRVELRLPTTPDGSWSLPSGLAGPSRRDLAFEDLFAAQVLLTTQNPSTGRTDQFDAEAVRIESRSLLGPWRAEGSAGGVPFRLVTGELGEGDTVPVKLSGGGDLHPRFDLDALVALAPTPGTPVVSGTAKVLLGPPHQAPSAGPPVPAVLQAGFKSDGGAVILDPVAIDAGEGGGSLRLTGTGRIAVETSRLALKLDGRRLDLDRLLGSPAAPDPRQRAGWLSLAPPVDLDLALNAVAVAGEELTELKARLSLDSGRARVHALQFTAPGEARVTAEGEAGLAPGEPVSGRIAVAASNSDRLARVLAKLEGGGPVAAFLDGKPLDASAEIALTPSSASLGNAQVRLGDAVLTGSARYEAPVGGARGRLRAELGAERVDFARMPALQGVFDGIRSLDMSLALDARNVRYGDAAGAGRITARVASDGAALLVEQLDVTDLAGANARVGGRIAGNGSGRIEGRLVARRAAPLIDLLGGASIGGVAKLIPGVLRDGSLDVDLAAERAAPGDGPAAPALRTTLRGTAAGGTLQADLRTVAGRTDAFTVRLQTADTGLWVGRPDAGGLRRPSTLDLAGARAPSGRLDVTLAADLGGVRVATDRPFALGAGDDSVESGTLSVAASDVAPFLVLLGDGAAVPGPVAADGRLTFDREGDAARVGWSGTVAGAGAQARWAARPDGALEGELSLERLSLPWLLSALALGGPTEARPASLWSTVRFGPARRAIATGQATVKVGRLDLGRALQAEQATFVLGVTPDGLSLGGVDARLAGGRLSGQITVGRQGGLASFVGEGKLDDAALPALLGSSFFDGRLGIDLKFGTSGESVAGAVASLAGAGEIRLAGLRVADANSGALERALPRVLNDSDPLSARRIEAILGEELGRGPLLVPSAAAPATLVGGTVRFGPLSASTAGGTWRGAAALDLKTLTLDASGLLTARNGPKGWAGAPPSVTLAWRGPVAAPERSVEVGPVLNGLAAVVLQRELEKIEAFEAEANERARLKGRLDYERDVKERERRAAEEARRLAEEAARQARLAAEEEARRARLAAEDAARRQAEEARQARLREQRAAEEVARQARLQAAEDARQARAREQQAEAERVRAVPAPPSPVEIRPAPPIPVTPGG